MTDKGRFDRALSGSDARHGWARDRRTLREIRAASPNKLLDKRFSHV